MFVEKPRRETQRFEAGRDLKSENFVRSDGSSYESGASEHFQMEMILSSWKQDAVKNVSGFNLLLCCYQHKRCPSSQCTKSVYEADVKTLFVPTCGSMCQSFDLMQKNQFKSLSRVSVGTKPIFVSSDCRLCSPMPPHLDCLTDSVEEVWPSSKVTLNWWQ